MARRRPQFAPTIEQAIQQAASRYGVSADAMKAIARVESSGNPRAVTGSYKGLFQLSNQEFRKYNRQGDIFNPADNANAAAAKIRNESQWFERRFGRAPTVDEVYLIHQQGVGGATQHLRNPDAPAWENMLSTAEGRRKGASWAKQAIWGNIPSDLKRQFGSVDNVTSAQFRDLWRQVIATRGGLSPEQVAMPIIKGAAATQVAQATPPPPVRPDTAEGLTPGQATVAANDANQNAVTQSQQAEAVAQSAPELVGPLGPIGGGYGSPSMANTVPETPGAAPPNTDPVVASAVPYTNDAIPPNSPATTQPGTLGEALWGQGIFGQGGGLLGLGSGGLISTLTGNSGGGGLLGLKGGGGGGAPKIAFSQPKFDDPAAQMAAYDSPQEDVLPTKLPAPPPRTPPGMPVADFFGKRRKRQLFG